MQKTLITGSGAFIPERVQSNDAFAGHIFYSNGKEVTGKPGEIVRKFQGITGIDQRRYASDDMVASDLASRAAEIAFSHSGTSREEIDQIVVAHNFGNIKSDSVQSVFIPSLASQVKHQLGIQNPNCVAYDLIFGCPGWLQGVIQCDAYFKAGLAKKALVIGAETLSRVVDSYDRDSMIFGDGAGATILEYKDSGARNSGILSCSAQSHTVTEVNYINMGCSDNHSHTPGVQYMKMNGRKVYEYALTHVPLAMKDCMDKSGASIHELKKIFIHQANTKMDEAMTERFYQLYGLTPPEHVMPMSVHWLGNSSVATIPTLYDLVLKNQMPPHGLSEGDLVLFASVGAGMNINAVCYRC